MIIKTAAVAVVTTVVTLGVSNFDALWHVIRPSPPVKVETEHRRLPVEPSSPFAAPSPSKDDPSIAKESPRWMARLWALPGSVDSVATPLGAVDPLGAEFPAWVAQAGGADVGTTRLRIVVTAQDKDVVITGVCAHLTAPRGAPMDGTLMLIPPQGDTPAPASIDLDSEVPCAPEFGTTPAHVEARKNLVIDVSATTRSHTVSWYPELHLVVDGKRRTIPAGGQQTYRTTALLGDLTLYGHYFQYESDFSPPRFQETLPDPASLASFRRLAYGGNG